MDYFHVVLDCNSMYLMRERDSPHSPTYNDYSSFRIIFGTAYREVEPKDIEDAIRLWALNNDETIFWHIFYHHPELAVFIN